MINLNKVSQWKVMALMLLLALSVELILSSSVQAIPAFARQTSQPCTSCHSLHYPTLNSFGRLFKAQGFTMVGGQPQVEGNGLSLPGVLNAALMGDLQYIKGDEQEIGFPAALSLYLAGKAGDKAGFMLEIPFEKQTVETTDGNGNVSEGETEGSVASFGSLKVNYIDQFAGFNIGAIAFSTEMAGPAYGYELLSTGAMGMNVAQTGSNAMGAIGMHMEHGSTLMSKFMGENTSMPMAGAATGFGVSAQNTMGFLYFASYTAQQKIEHFTNPKFSNYLRAAWTPSFAGFEIGTGFQLYFGETTSGATGQVVDAKAATFDFQAQGNVIGKPVGFYATYAATPKSKMGAVNHYNMSTGGDNNAFGLLAEVGVMEKVSLSLGFVSATYWMDMKNDMGMTMSMEQEGTSTSVGAEYLFRPNVRMALRFTSFGADFNDNATVATIYAGL